MPGRERARGFLELTRPANAVAAAALTFTGAFVAGGIFSNPAATGAAVGATVFATAAGNAINDYFDRDIDRINRPDRAIPRGAVTPREALAFAVALFVGAVGFAVVLPAIAIAIAVVNLLALVAYTKLFKGTPGVGNAVVAYLTGSTFLFGGAAVGELLGAAVLATLAAIATFARELIKDVEDVAGDRAEGLRTLPIVVGARPTLVLGVLVVAFGVLASSLPYLDGAFGFAYLVVVIPADLVMLSGTLRSFRDPAAGQRQLKVGMFLAAAAFLVGRAATLV